MNNTQLLNKFKKELIKRNMSEKTIRSYRYDIDKFLKSNNALSLNTVTKEDIKDFIKYEREVLGNTSRTTSKTISALRKLYDVIRPKDNPALGLGHISIEEPLPLYLTRKEIDNFFNNIPENTEITCRDKTMFELMYSCGLYVSEVVDLKMNQINLDNKSIKLSDRQVPISEEALRLITKYLSIRHFLLNDTISDYVFISNKKGSLDRKSVWRILNKRGIDVDLHKPINTSILRHSFAIHLIDAGGDLKLIAELFGYTDIKQTYAYIKAIKERDMKDFRVPNRGQRL